MSSGPVACDKCGDKVKDEKYLQRHEDEVHCSTAVVLLPDGTHLIVPRGANRRFQCPLCSITLKTGRTLNGHIEKSCSGVTHSQRPLNPARSPGSEDDGDGLYLPGVRNSQPKSHRKKKSRNRTSDTYPSDKPHQYHNQTDSAAATNDQVHQPSLRPAAVELNQGSKLFASGSRHVEPQTQAAPLSAVDPVLRAFLAALRCPLGHHIDAFLGCGIDSMMKLDMLPAMPDERKIIDEELKKEGVTVFELSMRRN
ncbi:unnamed protein product [Somion occarium]|uniref:C2H2-type domain-containing protein n=1 Tax=Somion occarium TaxID=3059160 RepID=A0ABP1CIT6_9APHY